MFYVEFFNFFPSKLSPPSANRFRQNFAVRRMFVGNKKDPLHILLNVPKRN